MVKRHRRDLAVFLLALFTRGVAAFQDTPPPAGRAAAPSVAEPSRTPMEGAGDPKRLQQTVRVVTETNAPPVPVEVTNRPKAFHVDASWRGWNGLHLELTERTSLPNLTGPFIGRLSGTNGLGTLHLE